MELGCFLAGLMFSMADATSARLNTGFHAGNHGITHRLMTLVDPVKDLFLAIFFASVGTWYIQLCAQNQLAAHLHPRAASLLSCGPQAGVPIFHGGSVGLDLFQI